MKYLTEKGYECVWKHISDKPDDERRLCAKHIPVLQDGSVRISARFRLERRGGATWDSGNRRHVRVAEMRLYRLFAETFRV